MTSSKVGYNPFLLSVKQLLQDPSVLEQVQQCHNRIHHDEKMEDFCDGSLFANHTLFSHDSLALQILAFYDEVEICNPLGAHIKKHKLGVVFFTVGNIHPKFRSSLRAIHLLIVPPYPVIAKHDLDEILKPFLSDLRVLSDTGVDIDIDGEVRTFHGALLCFQADNLASHALGGFNGGSLEQGYSSRG